MVVISIILILLGVAIPIYSHSIVQAREENLRQNLETLNQMIFQYAHRQAKSAAVAGRSADGGLHEEFRMTSRAAITGRRNRRDGTIMSLDQTDTDGIIGVHSGSNQIGSDGTAYSDW